MYRVTKRDGSITEFHIAKIANAITKAFEAVGRQYHPSVIELLALRVTAEFEPKIRHDLIAVEDIQDCVERVLSEAGYADVAKAYILYRKQREKLRNVGSTLLNYKELVDNYLRINDWRVKENSTVTYSVGGLILSNSGAITANYWQRPAIWVDGKAPQWYACCPGSRDYTLLANATAEYLSVFELTHERVQNRQHTQKMKGADAHER